MSKKIGRRALCLSVVVAAGFMVSSLSMAQSHSSLPDVIDRVKPSVVIIGSFNPTAAPRFTLRGTGFVVGQGNWVVSNAHVTNQEGAPIAANQLVVQVRTGPGTFQTRKAKVLEENRAQDLVLLSFEGPPVAAMKIGDSDRVREGQDMAFMGFPIGGVLGFAPVTHKAMVSSITEAKLPRARGSQLTDQDVRNLREANFNLFQLDAIAYPGNSGGPLFDPQTGELLGVMNMVALKSSRESALSQPSGISYAIPAKHVQAIMAKHR